MGEWLHQAFKKFGEISTTQGIILGTLLILGLGLLMIGGKKVKWSTRMLTYAALSIALSFVLSMVRLYRMPQGGSVTAAGMLPLILFSYAFGTVPGLIVGAVYGLLDFISNPYFLNIWSFLLDYIVAYALVGLAGLFGKVRNEKLGLSLGVVTACVTRFIASLLSGVMFYASYADGTGMSPFGYSVWYNGSYMLPEMIICVLIALLIGTRVIKAIRRA